MSLIFGRRDPSRRLSRTIRKPNQGTLRTTRPTLQPTRLTPDPPMLMCRIRMRRTSHSPSDSTRTTVHPHPADGRGCLHAARPPAVRK